MSNDNNQELSSVSTEQQAAIADVKAVLASKQDVLMAIGQIQAFNNVRKYVTVTEIITYKKIKESKQYKGLVYEDADGKSVTVTDLKEVCSVFFGRSYEQMQEDLKNLEAFGQEFLESAQNMGLGYRDLRKLRQLPSDEQSLIINSEAVNFDDKEALKSAIEDYTFSHVTEKAELNKKLDEACEDVEAARDVSSQQTRKLNEAEEREAKRRFSQEPWKHQTMDSAAAMMKAKVAIEQGVNQLNDVFLNLSSDESLDEKALALVARSLLTEIVAAHSRINNFANDVFGVLGSKYSPDVSAEDTFFDLQYEDVPAEKSLVG